MTNDTDGTPAAMESPERTFRAFPDGLELPPQNSKSRCGMCRFYVTHKQRFCKFPASGSDGYCHTHASVNAGSKKTRIPCPMDPRHSIYANHVRSHLKCCTRVRDVAWELGQPFVYEDVHLLRPSSIRDPSSRIDGTPLLHAKPSTVAQSTQAERGQSALYKDARETVQRDQSLTYDAFCERSKHAILQRSARMEEHQSRDREILDLRQFSTDPDNLEQLHSAIDQLYKKSCTFLGKSPEYFMETRCTGSPQVSLVTGNPIHNTPSSCHAPPEKNGLSAWNGCNCASCSCPLVVTQWETSPRFRECVRRTMEATERQRAQTRLHVDAQHAVSSNDRLKEEPNRVGAPNKSLGCGENLPDMNKHELQNAALLALSLERGYVRLPSATCENDLVEGTIVVEFGAGRGALTRWFRLALESLSAPGYASTKFILIDREKRRNKAENKSALQVRDQDEASTHVLRVRADIRDFYLAGLVHQLVDSTADASVPRSHSTHDCPRLLTYLSAFECFGPQHNTKTSKVERTWQPETFPSLKEQRAILDKLGKGGGLPIEELRAKVSQHFTHASWSAQKSLKSFKLLCVAKHLCGGATDAALLSAVESQRCLHRHRGPSNYAANTSPPFSLETCLTIAPCCHHRCTWDTLVGQTFLRSLGMNRTIFDHLVHLCGWGTGSTGLKQRIGLKLKRIIDASRVMWLREQGFSDANLVVFVHSAHVTMENVVIASSFLAENAATVQVLQGTGRISSERLLQMFKSKLYVECGKRTNICILYGQLYTITDKNNLAPKAAFISSSQCSKRCSSTRKPDVESA